jgi:chaperonin GroES
MKITPLADRILVESLLPNATTSGGIIIPDAAMEKSQKGKVVAVGKGTSDEPVTLKVGDVILFGKYGGADIKIDNKDYLIMKESEVIALII